MPARHLGARLSEQAQPRTARPPRAALRHTRVLKRYAGLTLTLLPQILKRYAGRAAPRRVANDELVVIMMASQMRADLAHVMRTSWLRNFPHVFIVGDADNASVPMITLPELAGLGGYGDAQHRHLRAMRFIHDNRPQLLDKRFFLLIGARARPAPEPHARLRVRCDQPCLLRRWPAPSASAALRAGY